MPLPHDFLTPISQGRSNQGSIGDDSGASYEVFRNNTTAVEVVVKDVFKGNKRPMSAEQNDVKLNKLHAEVERLKSELEIANKSLGKTRKGFRAIVQVMRKQIDTANARESSTQTQHLSLQLENEKLRIILESKTKLLSRIKKEMTSMKRVLKSVIKSVCDAPEFPQNTVDSDVEYEDFKTDLKRNVHVKFHEKDLTETFDSSI